MAPRSVRPDRGAVNSGMATILLLLATAFVLAKAGGSATATDLGIPLYIPSDVPCSELFAFHQALSEDGTGDGSEAWSEAPNTGDGGTAQQSQYCHISYAATAVSTLEGMLRSCAGFGLITRA